MNRTIVAVALTMLTLPAFADGNPEGFYRTYSQAQKQAQKLNKPLYIHFTTTWCKWCRKMEADTYASDAGKAALKDFVPVSLDCTVEEGSQPTGHAKTNLDLYGKLGGRDDQYPFIAILAPDGAVIDTVGHYMEPELFVAMLARATKIFKEYNDFLDYAKTADHKSLAYNSQAMTVLAKVHKTEQAAQCALEVLKLDPENKDHHASSANLILLYDVQEKGDQKKMQDAFNKVMKLDPTNADGNLEKACMAEADRHFQLAKKLQSKKELQNALAILVDLDKRAKKLESAQDVYATAGMMNLYLENTDSAIAYFNKAVAADPKSAEATQIKDMLDRLKPGREATKSATSKPAE